MGLHSSFIVARGRLLMKNPWPSVNQAFMLLKQEERQRQTHSAVTTPISMMVNLAKPTSASNTKFSHDRSVVECSHCHIKGHTKEKCYKLVGYPPDHPFHPNNRNKRRTGYNNKYQNQIKEGQNISGQAMQVSGSNTSVNTQMQAQMEALQTQMQTLMESLHKDKTTSSVSQSSPYNFSANITGTAFSFQSSVAIANNVWIIDTGATNHMCCSLDFMHDIVLLDPHLSVNFPNGTIVSVTHNGSVKLHSISIVLRDVLFIPSFDFNLLSICKLCS